MNGKPAQAHKSHAIVHISLSRTSIRIRRFARVDSICAFDTIDYQRDCDKKTLAMDTSEIIGIVLGSIGGVAVFIGLLFVIR